MHEKVTANTKARVLYIEDDHNSRRLVQLILKQSGYEVLTAADGIEGITLAYETYPHLILMDINLPHMDGRAITTRLRSSPEFLNTPIIALTADSSEENRKMALAAGCTGFLTKPINVDALPDQIESFLLGHEHHLSTKEYRYHLERHTQGIVAQLEDKVLALKKANSQMQELNRLKGDFLFMASQELSDPLWLARSQLVELASALDGLGTEAMPQYEELASLLPPMQKGMERLSRVVEEIQTVANITNGLVNLTLLPAPLNELVADVLTDYAEIIEARQLRVQVSSLDHLPVVLADRQQLQTAVANLVSNAIKYTPDEGRIFIRGEETEEEVRLHIQDTGAGIESDKLDLIFDLFSSLTPISYHSTSKHAYQGGGLGLGLPMAKGIVEAHNGRILVESCTESSPEQPTGATFTICLPCA